MKSEWLENLPGEELIRNGMRDLQVGRCETIEALLIGIGAPRLRSLGFDLPFDFPDLPEHELYLRLSEEHGNQAHSRYNALIRRLVSFERALDGRLRRMAATGA